MRVPLFARAVMACGLGLLLASTLQAQRAVAPGPQSTTALIDMNLISQKSTRFKAQIDALKTEMETKAAKFKKESELGNELGQKVRALPADSPERKQRETELLKMRADFELEGKKFSDEMHDRESKLVYALSREVREELARFAAANGIELVLRYDSTPPDLNDPRAILQEIQKPVVYQRDLDATNVVLDQMNRRSATPATTARPPAKAAQR